MSLRTLFTAAAGTFRSVLRGGSWLSLADELDSAHRYGEATEYRVQGYVLGFRVARALAP